MPRTIKGMKKSLLCAVVILAAVLAVQFPSVVSAAGGNVTITGKMTNKGAPVKNAPLNITVNGSPLPPTTTDDNGNFTVTTDDTIVPPGSPTTIEIDTNGNGLPERTIETTGHEVITINFDVDPFNVPEYNWLSGVAAAGAGFGFIAWQRRQRQAAHQQF